MSPHPIRLHLAGEAKCIRKATSELGVVVEVGEADMLSVGVGGGKTDFAECEVGRDGRKAAMREGREVLGRELSSIYWVHKEQPPIFILHGDADPQVSITQSERFLKRCHEVGTVCELVIRKGAGHGGWQEMPQDTERMVEWFDLHLLGKQPAKPFTLKVSSLPSRPAKK